MYFFPLYHKIEKKICNRIRKLYFFVLINCKTLCSCPGGAGLAKQIYQDKTAPRGKKSKHFMSSSSGIHTDCIPISIFYTHLHVYCEAVSLKF